MPIRDLIMDEIVVASATTRSVVAAAAAVGVAGSKVILCWQMELALVWQYGNAQCGTLSRSDSCIVCYSSQLYTCMVFEHLSLHRLKYPPLNVHAFDDI